MMGLSPPFHCCSYPRSRLRKPVFIWILSVCPSKDSRNKIQASTLKRRKIFGEVDIPLHLAHRVLGELVGLTSHTGKGEADRYLSHQSTAEATVRFQNADPLDERSAGEHLSMTNT